MKKIYEAPSVEITAFKSEEVMNTVLASTIAVQPSLESAITDISIDF